MKPFFSIIVASYNYENYIGETIQSILEQTFSNFEVVVVDDGSKDNSIKVIEEFVARDSRVKLFTHPNNENKGLIKTVQYAIEKSQGEYIAFLESDDLFLPSNLEEKYKAITNDPEIGLIFNDIELFGDEQMVEEFNWYFEKRNRIFANEKIKYINLSKVNIIPTFSCNCVRKELFKDLVFESEIPQSIDWCLWTQILVKTKSVFINQKLTKWRMHPVSYMSDIKRDNENIQNAKLLKFLYPENKYSFIISFYKAINQIRFEKLFRSPVRLLNKWIDKYFEDRFINLSIV